MSHYVYEPRKYYIVSFLIFVIYLQECKTQNVNKITDKKYVLASEAYNVAQELFLKSHQSYDELKKMSHDSINMFLDLVTLMNSEMAKDLRSAIIKYYKSRFFHDFRNYVISMDEVVEIVDHCLLDPSEKVEEIRNHFNDVISNFADIRNFSVVNKCHNELPDEVAAAHCILHQAVLFNETMKESLMRTVQLKLRQHAQDLNTTLWKVHECFNSFIPKFYEQLLIDAYKNSNENLKVVFASIADMASKKWKNNVLFTKKWTPFVMLLKSKMRPHQGLLEPLILTLFAANMTSNDVVKILK